MKGGNVWYIAETCWKKKKRNGRSVGQAEGARRRKPAGTAGTASRRIRGWGEMARNDGEGVSGAEARWDQVRWQRGVVRAGDAHMEWSVDVIGRYPCEVGKGNRYHLPPPKEYVTAKTMLGVLDMIRWCAYFQIPRYYSIKLEM